MPPKTIIGELIDRSPVEMQTDQLIWRPGTYALIFNEKGELLLLDNTANALKDIPGGGLELWEQTGEGLRREVWEETGLEVEVGAVLHVEDKFFKTRSGRQWHALNIFYRARVTGGSLRPTIIDDEHSVNPHWVDPLTLRYTDLTIGWQALQIALHGPGK